MTAALQSLAASHHQSRHAAAQLHTPWGRLPASRPIADNDNLPRVVAPGQPLMIGLTGKRNVGKSTVADLLVEEFGFERVHAFEAGKRASVAWFDAMGGDGERMVYGDLKDKPSDLLPGGVPPRYFLERFGHFMGHEMGVEWTLDMEIDAARKRSPRAPIVVESLVYEAPRFKARGGVIWRLERPGHEGPAGIESDKVQALIEADDTIRATSVEELERQARSMIQQMVGGR